MKELLEKMAWKKCHIITVNTKFEFVRFVNEAKEGSKAPVFVPHDL